jgi:sugar O-acyltransferase (sialic acid O-acetyltransferase NeuD family)
MSNSKKVIIFGTTQFAQIAYYYLTHDSPYEVVGFTVNKEFMTQEKLFELPIIPFENIESNFSPSDYSMFVAVGYINVNKTRAKIYNKAKNKGYKLISYVNSKSTTWNDLDIGDNCFIFENNVIQPFTKIGNDVILWSGNHIGHHNIIKDHCFFASHVVVSGNVTIEPYCFLGVNSTIRDGIVIGSECVIGAGSLILENTKSQEVYTTEKAKLLSVKSNDLSHF